MTTNRPDPTRVVLLDLQGTLVIRGDGKPAYYPPHTRSETYRPQTVGVAELAADAGAHVAIVTVRDHRWADETLLNLLKVADWQPDSAWFRTISGMSAPAWKRHVVVDLLAPLFGDSPRRYLAVESNQDTIAMYQQLGIEAVHYRDAWRWRTHTDITGDRTAAATLPPAQPTLL